jgi:hypothetical protein
VTDFSVAHCWAGTAASPDVPDPVEQPTRFHLVIMLMEHGYPEDEPNASSAYNWAQRLDMDIMKPFLIRRIASRRLQSVEHAKMSLVLIFKVGKILRSVKG